MKYHPDRGGNEKDIKIVNAAFSAFQQLLIEKRFPFDDEDSDEDPRENFAGSFSSIENFFIGIGVSTLTAATDIFAVDKAFDAFISLKRSRLLFTSFAKHNTILILDDLKKLIVRLSMAGRSSEAIEVASFYKEGCKQQIAGGLNADHFNSRIEEIDLKLRSGKKDRPILKHRLQADNALRLGMITLQRHRELSIQFDADSEGIKYRQQILFDFCRNIGFIEDLGIYSTELLQKRKMPLVPEPGYGIVRFQQLTEDQQIEYLHSFSASTTYDLALKYLYIRISSYFVALIKNFVGIDNTRILKEVEVLEKVFAKQNIPFAEVKGCCQYLNSISPTERAKRLALLCQLDIEDEIERNARIRVFISGEPLRVNHYKPIGPYPDYIKFMKQPLKSIVLYCQTGREAE